MEIMGCLSFVQVLAVNQKTKQGSTIYDHLFDRKETIKLRKAFTREYCRVYRITEESPLQKTIEAGTYAVPKLAKVRRMIKESFKQSHRELPCEVDLGPGFQFHNIFVCPVTKEPATSANPPQLLTCGHVISKVALHRMCRSERQKFKCHICPAQMMKEEVK